MKLWDIVKTVGSGIIKEVVPGGGAILSVINDLLPDDKKLPHTATGYDINNAIETLPPEQRVAVFEKEFDVDITRIKEAGSTLRAMLEFDSQNPHSTRPKIALYSFYVIAFAIVVAISAWGVGVLRSDEDMIKAVVDGWPFILAMIGPLVILLHGYFGVLKIEHKNRLDAAGGNSTPSGIVGILSSLIKRG